MRPVLTGGLAGGKRTADNQDTSQEMRFHYNGLLVKTEQNVV